MVKDDMEPILQSHLPFAPWMEERTRRLPGVVPLEYADWLQVDDAYSAQLAYKAKLLAERRDAVLQMQPDCLPAAQELLDVALAHRPKGFEGDETVVRPDGMQVAIDRARPLMSLSQLFQEDFVILQEQGDVHVLTGALLCFPASWSLADKFARPLTEIHAPVDEYDEGIARSVERMFSAIRVEQPLMRGNVLMYGDPDLHHPKRGSDALRGAGQVGYIRSERQCMVRLPQTRAVVFSIHTYLLREESLTGPQREALRAHPVGFEEAPNE